MKTLLILMLIPILTLGQTTVQIEPPKDDAWIYQASPNNNYGSSVNLSVGYDVNGDEIRMLIKWDLSPLPNCVNIESAEIRLNQWSDNPIISADICRINESWEESTVTWNNQPSCTGFYGSKSFSSSGTQTIPATDLVKDWIQYGNEGVMFKIASGTNNQAFDSKEASSSDPRLTITYTSCVSVEENNLDNELKVYPNPNNGKFIVELSDKYNLKVFDVVGKLVYEMENSGKSEIDLSGNEKGIYFLSFETEKGVIRKKVVFR